MPYIIKKVKSGQFFVENKSTGRKFSNKVLSLPKAKAQLAALEIHAHDYPKAHGKGMHLKKGSAAAKAFMSHLRSLRK